MSSLNELISISKSAEKEVDDITYKKGTIEECILAVQCKILKNFKNISNTKLSKEEAVVFIKSNVDIESEFSRFVNEKKTIPLEYGKLFANPNFIAVLKKVAGDNNAIFEVISVYYKWLENCQKKVDLEKAEELCKKKFGKAPRIKKWNAPATQILTHRRQ